MSLNQQGRWLKRWTAVAAVAVTATLVITGCAGGGDNDSGGDAADGDGNITIRLVTNNTNSSLAAVVADQKGFFTENGLNVELTQVADISKVPQTLGNQYDIGFGVQPLVIRGSVQGLNTIAVAGNGASSEDAPFMVLMARADSGIKTAEDLRGKRIAAPTLTGTHHTATLYWLQQAGVEQDEVQSVQVATPSMIDQLVQGQIDVAELQEPFITEAKRQGLEVVAFSSGAVAPTTIESLWISTPDWAEGNPEAVERFRAALNQAVAWMEDSANEDEAKEILAEFTKQDPTLVAESPLLKYRVELTAKDLEVWGIAMAAVTDFDAEVDYDKLVLP